RKEPGEVVQGANRGRPEGAGLVRPVLHVEIDTPGFPQQLFPLDEEERPGAEVLHEELAMRLVDVPRPDELNEHHGAQWTCHPCELPDRGGGIHQGAQPDLPDGQVEDPVLEGQLVQGSALEVDPVLQARDARTLLRLRYEGVVGVQTYRIDAVVRGEIDRRQPTTAGGVEDFLVRAELREQRDLAVEGLAAGGEDGIGRETDDVEQGGRTRSAPERTGSITAGSTRHAPLRCR